MRSHLRRVQPMVSRAGAGVCLALMIGLSGGGAALAEGPALLLSDGAWVERAKAKLEAGDTRTQDALESVVRDAEEYLGKPIAAVTDKQELPPSGDRHDYASLSPYWWPDEESEDGLPYVRRDGQVNPERADYDLPRLDNLTRAVRWLGIAYHFTGDERYAERAAEWLRTWFIDPQTRMNPRLKFGQFVPGRDEGRPFGIIETTRFLWMLDSTILLRESQAWSDEDHEQVQDWFAQYLDWLLTSDLGREEASQPNNHGTWYHTQAATYALFVNDEQTAREMFGSARSLIDSQFEADGRQPRELARTLSLHYSTYNLRGHVHLAHLAERVGADLWSHEGPEGQSLREGLEFLIPFYLGEQTWEYEQISDASPEWFCMVLRRAAYGYEEPAYEQVVQEMDEDVWSWVNLMMPAYEGGH